jgi:subtilase family serine protease
MRWHHNLTDLLLLRPTPKRPRPKQRVRLQLEELETRALLSGSSATMGGVQPLLTLLTPQASAQQTSSTISGYTPQQIQQAYGVDSLLNNGTNGAGETIAIVDAYYDPNIINDANTFSTQFNLPLFNSSGGPTLKVVASGGGPASSLSQDPSGGWPLETSLDVEWAHAIAPQANILLVEAPDGSDASVFQAVQYAAAQPGVVAVSMSWGDYEFSDETSYDSYFLPPSSNPGVVFVAASGDEGAWSGPIYPATSPYVLAVGGTTLGGSTSSTSGYGYSSSSFFTWGTSWGSFYARSASARPGGGLYTGAGSLSVVPAATSSSGTSNYPGETAWYGSGGGASAYEGEPSYQYNQQSIDNTYGYPNVEVYDYRTGTASYYYSRMTPDVAYNADPNTGYAIYDSIASPDYGFSGGWGEVGGTSAGAPQWSALVALADQQRAAMGEKPLDTNEVQNQLYNSLSNGNYANIFHDITTGSNGYSAGPGYDIVTGLGTPIANALVPYLASTTIPLGQLPTIQGSGYGGVSGSTGASFGSTTFSSTSYYGFTAAAQPGGGLYAGAGSLSIPPNSTGAYGLNGQAGSAAAASATPQASVSLSSFANTLTFSPATMDAAATTPITGENNFLGQTSTLMPGSPLSVGGSTTLAASTNAPTTLGNNEFGASGWKGLSSSWRLGSLDLPVPQVDPQAQDQSEEWQDLNGPSADDVMGTDTSNGVSEDWSEFDFLAPVFAEDGSDASDGGSG